MDKSFIINMSILHKNSQNYFNAHIREKNRKQSAEKLLQNKKKSTNYEIIYFRIVCNNKMWTIKWGKFTKIVTGQFWFTFMHLADAFIQSDLQCIQAIHFMSVCVFPGKHTTFCTANAMLYHWATGTRLMLSLKVMHVMQRLANRGRRPPWTTHTK